ncbi:hypothetical protein LLB_2391 [Legionella longbeachae D-4968]|nr:hypothetical protein LLB_2391 [Legionella longbeachae D-4968]
MIFYGTIFIGTSGYLKKPCKIFSLIFVLSIISSQGICISAN